MKLDEVRSSSKKPIALWFFVTTVTITMISPRPSTRQPETAAIGPGKKHYCDCSRYCKGRRIEVHRSTYQRHARFRQADLEKSLARNRRDKIDESSLSLLEGGSTNRPSGTHWQERMGMMEIRQPQVRHTAVF